MTHSGGQQSEVRRTWRTPANISKQALATPPFGTTCFSPSTDVFHPLHKPSESIPCSAAIALRPKFACTIFLVICSTVRCRAEATSCVAMAVKVGFRKKANVCAGGHLGGWRIGHCSPLGGFEPWDGSAKMPDDSQPKNRYWVEEKGSGTESNRWVGSFPSSPLLIGTRLLSRERAPIPYHTYAQEERDTEQDN